MLDGFYKERVRRTYLCGVCPQITTPFSDDTFKQHILDVHSPELEDKTWWAQSVIMNMLPDMAQEDSGC